MRLKIKPEDGIISKLKINDQRKNVCNVCNKRLIPNKELLQIYKHEHPQEKVQRA